MKINKSIRLSLAVKRSLTGYAFTSIFVIGFIFLFLSPLLLYIKMSFSSISPGKGSILFKYVGIDNYTKILLTDIDFLKNVFGSFSTLLITCPIILLFSFFIANILNQKFAGRSLFRAIFFLPVITASGIALAISSDSSINLSLQFLSGETNSQDVVNITRGIVGFLGVSFSNIPIVDYVTDVLNQIYNIIIASGVQILVFLAGLQAIPRALYEASSLEGSTAWEDLWKITLPMISPIILVNAVYTIIDSLAGLSNPIVNMLYDEAINKSNYSYSAAMGIMYFTIMIFGLGIVIYIANKFVFYENK